MSDNELDELLSQLKDACRKSRHSPTAETNLQTILKKIDVFINRRQMKLSNHQKRVEDLQRDLLLSECESSRNRIALEKKDVEVNQLHDMLDKAERTAQNIITKYDVEMRRLTDQLCNVQQDYDRLKTMHRSNQEERSMQEMTSELKRLHEFNKMLESDNQRLYAENEQLKFAQRASHPRLLQSSNVITADHALSLQPKPSKVKTLEDEIEGYKRRSSQQSADIEQLRASLNDREQRCQALHVELQRVQSEKEILKVHLIEQRMMQSSPGDLNEMDYETFIRNELETNIGQANKLINYWNCHKQTLDEKIRRLTDEIQQLKKHNADDLSVQISRCNENVLHAKRDMNALQMEITDKNTVIYNLYRKIECLEQALAISQQRTSAQLNEIEELRARKETKRTSAFFDGLSTDDEGQLRRSIELNANLYTSSPIKCGSMHRHFRHVDSDTSCK